MVVFLQSRGNDGMPKQLREVGVRNIKFLNLKLLLHGDF